MGEAAARERGTSVPLLKTGEVVDGKFRIERTIGTGGMGIVYEATHLKLDQRVALKFLHPDAVAKPGVVDRFSHEARAAVKLKSEHVARVIDVGARDDGTPFMVMELLEGHDLRAELDKGPLTVKEAADYIIQACEGLADAHANDIIHQDIKPENLFLVQRGEWPSIKIVDFGIAKALSGDQAEAIPVMGSPHYMSPEQLRGGAVDHRSDIWSLGAVLFELITGTTAFRETNVTRLVAEVTEDPHLELSSLRADVPPELEAIVDRCLSKFPERRFQDVAELAVALLPYARSISRAPAQRAVGLLRSAGKLANSQTEVPGSIAPLAPSEPIRVSIPGAPPAVRSTTPESPASPKASAPTHASDSAPAEERRKPPVVWIALAVLLLGGATAFALTRGPGEKPGASPNASATTSAAHAESTTTNAAATLPGTTPAATAPNTPASAAAVDSAATPPSIPSANVAAGRPTPVQPRRPLGTPPHTPTATSTAPPAPRPNPDLEIRRER